MTPYQIDLVKVSFVKVAPIAEQAASMFYGRLFEIAPPLRALFKGDLKDQGGKLMGTIGLAVASLDRLPELVPALEQLGRRHRAYGVKDEDYDVVAQALLWTLGQGLGDAFTAEVKEAWAAAYTLLADTMMRAARQAAA